MGYIVILAYGEFTNFHFVIYCYDIIILNFFKSYKEEKKQYLLSIPSLYSCCLQSQFNYPIFFYRGSDYNQFNPDRFAPELEAKRSSFSWLPFSSSDRGCKSGII